MDQDLTGGEQHEESEGEYKGGEGGPLLVGTALVVGLGLTAISILAPAWRDASVAQAPPEDRIGPAIAIGAILGTLGTLLRAVAHNRSGAWRDVDYAGKLLAVATVSSVIITAFTKLTEAEQGSLQTLATVAAVLIALISVSIRLTQAVLSRRRQRRGTAAQSTLSPSRR